MRATGERITVWATPRPNHGQFLGLRRLGIHVRRQPCGNLGRRMHHAAASLRPRQAVTVIGTDCPALRPEHLRSLRSSQLPSVIPAQDGGYVAIRLRGANPMVFAAVTWGTPKVLKQTQRNFRRCRGGRVLALSLADLDHPRDYLRQRQQGLIPARALWRRSA